MCLRQRVESLSTNTRIGHSRLAGFALILLFSAPASGQGRMAFDFEHHRFDAIAEGDSATVHFRFVNGGDAPITLQDVIASCGCTTPWYTTEPVAPGERGEVAVTFHSKGLPGPFEKTVYVAADGADPRSVTLRIEGDVTPTFTIGGVRQGSVVFDSELWDAGALSTGEPIQHAFRYQYQGSAPFRVIAATASNPDVELIFSDRPLFEGGTAGVLVIVDDPSTLTTDSGQLEISITLETTDETQPTKSLRIRGRVETGA